MHWPRWLQVLGLALLAFAVLFAAGLVGGFASGFLGGYARSHRYQPAQEMLFFVNQAGIYGVFAAAAVLLGRASGEWRADFGWRLVPFDVWLVAEIIAAQVLCAVWVISVVALLGAFPSSTAKAAGVFDPWLRFAALLVFMLVAPLVEELLFRGWLQARARRVLPKAGGVTFTAVLFASAHFDGSLRKPIAILGLGFATGWLRERSGSLLPGMVLHIANNTMAMGLSLLVR